MLPPFPTDCHHGDIIENIRLARVASLAVLGRWL
jgi:hypothetical protein